LVGAVVWIAIIPITRVVVIAIIVSEIVPAIVVSIPPVTCA
jgi:hypothetical protein